MENNYYKFEYFLDRDERTQVPSGNITIIVKTDNGHVKDVQSSLCTLEAVRTTVKEFYDEFETVHLPANTTGLYDYEFIFAEMDKELTELKKQQALEAKQLEKEKNIKTAKRVLDMLNTESFDEFYKGAHEDYILGEPNALSEDKMIELVINKFIKKF